MDLLGSILGGMDALPKKAVDEHTKKRVEEAKEKAIKFKEDERKKKAQFRTKMEARINKFLQGPSDERKLQFETMNKVLRSIVHDVAETGGLSAYSFGEEDVDRHIQVWKKEYAPTDAEIEALQNGEQYDPLAVKIANEVKQQNNEKEDVQKNTRKRRSKNTEQEPEKYFEKYAKILGQDSGLDAAKITKSNKSYGMVPSKNKEDKRSIEETMKEIRQRKIDKQLKADQVT